MTIKPDSRHLYLQVIDRIKQEIESGNYKEGEKLPSEFELSKILGVSRATLREALRILEEDHVVTRRHGVGTFVNPKPVFTSGIEELTSVTHMIKESGKRPGVKFLSTEYVYATEEDCEKFNNQNLSKIAEIKRIRTANDHPVVLCIDKIPEGLISLDAARKEDSIFKLIEKQTNTRIAYAVTYIEPVSYHPWIYDHLNCSPEQSLLLLKQMHYTEDDEAYLYSANYFRSDRFSFHVLRKRL